MQHALSFWSWLRPVDVGALIERPRAIDNRPYEFYRYIFEFCNTPFLTKLRPPTVVWIDTDGFARLRAGHGGCDSPPDCR